jgi:hypothetical protein
MSPARVSAFWRRWLQSQSLRGLLLAAITGALVPVFLLSFAQAFARLAHDREVVQSSLTDQVSISEEQALHVIETGKQALVRLSDRLDVRQGMPHAAKPWRLPWLACHLFQISPVLVLKEKSYVRPIQSM